ncbi:trypsin-like peptidase domain-containing protein [Actinoplanes sp. CA-252034]|uniref:trypsin-like peptidase domain-containing protein n=1 Tax=Actinoplanes sp. CA-252034 TaxID=3239906 RepID=UPI003D9A0765
MTDPWQPSGPWMMRFRQALAQAFNDQTMELLTFDHFAPTTFSTIASPAAGPFEYRLQLLINQARMEDWLLDLVAAAHERRPKNPVLAAIADDLGLTAGGARLDNPTGQPLQLLIQANAQFITPALFAQRLPVLEGRICWIAIPGGGGTGFLVGPDLLLTNEHVIRPILDGRVGASQVRCWFDHRMSLGNAGLPQKKITEVALAGDWLVDSRPPSTFDWTPALGDAGPEETDSALIRLADPVGDMPVGSSSDPADPVRGWIRYEAGTPLAVGKQVFLLQHPEGEPLQLTIGTVTAFNNAGTRVRYDANSKNGSSGAPCFDADLRLVALHHAHDPGFPPAWNQAVPIGMVRDVWRKHGVAAGWED